VGETTAVKQNDEWREHSGWRSVEIKAHAGRVGSRSLLVAVGHAAGGGGSRWWWHASDLGCRFGLGQLGLATCSRSPLLLPEVYPQLLSFPSNTLHLSANQRRDELIFRHALSAFERASGQANDSCVRVCQ
jgi:hypothetical protein